MRCIHQRMIFLLVPWAMLLIACGGVSTSSDTSGDTTDATDALSDADWRLVTGRRVQVGVAFDGAQGTLTLMNSSGATIESPTVFVYDTRLAKNPRSR